MNQSMTNMTDTAYQSSDRKVNHVSYSWKRWLLLFVNFWLIGDGLVNDQWLLADHSFSCDCCSGDCTTGHQRPIL